MSGPITSNIASLPYTIIGTPRAIGVGSYALVLKATEEARIDIGKLGQFALKQGYYVYSGSALGGLSARLARHFRPGKRGHWHIDYLTAQLQIQETWIVLRSERLECLCAQALRSLPGAEVPIPGFGSSDCHCSTHLAYFSALPSPHVFEQALLGLMQAAERKR